MPAIMVPDDTYARLAARAAKLDTTVEAIAVPVLEQAVREAPSPARADGSGYAEWKRGFDAMIADIRGGGPLYPPGHVVDVSRESMYEGCGE